MFDFWFQHAQAIEAVLVDGLLLVDSTPAHAREEMNRKEKKENDGRIKKNSHK